MQYDVGGRRPTTPVGAETGRPSVAGGRFVPWVLKVGALDFGLEQFMVVPILPAVEQCRSLTSPPARSSARSPDRWRDWSPVECCRGWGRPGPLAIGRARL